MGRFSAKGRFMKDYPAIYLGQIVSKQNFRVYVYSPNGSQKLVESWDEYEKEMASGLWFALKDDAMNHVPVVVEKIRSTRKIKDVIDSEVQEKSGELEENVKTDDFLPKSE